MAKLSAKKEAFCQFFIIHNNKAKAARLAGYSEKNSDVKGHQLSVEPAIKSRIEELLEERNKRLEISADRVLEEIAKIAFVDPTTIFTVDEHGNLTFQGDLADLKPEERACIASVSQTTTKEGGSTTIKLHDKLSALEKLGKHLKLFTDIQEHKFNVTQMGNVMMDKDGKAVPLEFDIGSDPNDLQTKH